MVRKYVAGILVIFSLLVSVACNGTPKSPGQESEFLDEYGCFPAGCDLPPGMKELCQEYEAGKVNWPANCSEMPGSACQALCEHEKANVAITLPTTTVDAYQVGWMAPVEVDDHIGDASRGKFGWIAGFPVVDNDDRVLLNYGGFYRYWDGKSLTDAEKWDAPYSGSHAIDQNNIHHHIATEKYGEDTALVHIIWDGDTFNKSILFSDQILEPLVSSSGLDVDESGNLHLTFQDRSMGFVETWYTHFDGSTWAQPINLSQSHINSFSSSLAVGKDDVVYVAWHEEFQEPSVGQTAQVVFRYKDQSGWSEPIISPMTATFVEVEADKRGLAYIRAENQFVIWDGAKWDGPYEIEYPEQATAFFQGAVEDNGQLHFMWNRYQEAVDAGTGEVVYEREVCYRKRTPEGSWGPVISLGVMSTAPTYAEFHSFMDIDSQGVVHTMFGGNMDGLLRLYYSNSGAQVKQQELLLADVFQPELVGSAAGKAPATVVTTLTDPNWKMNSVLQTEQKEPLLKAAVDSSGLVHAVWQHWDGRNFDIQYSRFDGKNWGQAVNLSQFEGAEVNPVIAVDSQDRVHVAWVRYEQGTSSIYWTYQERDVWSEPRKLSKKVLWKPPEMYASMVGVVGNAENAIRPAIAAGPDGMLVMSWSHEPEDWGFTGSVATAKFGGGEWSPEAFPGGSDSLALVADWSDVDIDMEGRLHLVFVFSGMMDEDSYLFSQPIHMMEEGGKWSDSLPLLAIPSDTNPYTQMVFRPFIKAASSGHLFVVFSMRPFDRDAFPYRLDIEDSNAYVVFRDGEEWGEPRRLDAGDSFGPSYVNMVLDADDKGHIVWAKYDAYSQSYSVYYTTTDGYQEDDVVLLWQSDQECDPLPILKPVITLGRDGKAHIIFSALINGSWETYHLSKP